MIAMDARSERRPTTTISAWRRSRSDAIDVSCLERPVVLGHRARSTGRRTAVAASASASRPALGHDFGIVRWKLKDGKPAFSPDRADWSKGQLRHRHRHAGQGRARRRVLARRQEARAGVQPRLVGLPAVARRRPGGLRAVAAPSRRRARLQGDLARRLDRSCSSSQGDEPARRTSAADPRVPVNDVA